MSDYENSEFNKGLKLLANSSIVVLAGLILSKVFTYAYRIILARQFGPEIYGLFSLGIMVVGWITSLSSLGLAEGLVRYIPFYRARKRNKEINYIVSFSYNLTLLSGILAGLMLFFLAEFISLNFFGGPDLAIFLKSFSIAIPLFLLMRFFLAIIRGFERISAYSFILNILQTGATLLVVLPFILLGASANSAIIYSYIAGFAFSLLAAYLFCRIKLPKIFCRGYPRQATRQKIVKKFLSYSWPLMFFAVLFKVLTWVDTLLIAYYKDAHSVGLYNAAIPIINILTLAPQIFMQLLFPLITKHYSKKNLEVTKQLSKQVGKWILILNIPLFLVIFLFPGAVINLLFGNEYLAAETPLKILAVSGIVSSFTLLSQNIIAMTGRSKVILYNFIGAIVLNTLMNMLLIPRYGINGAALSTTITWSLLGLILLLEVRQYLNFVPLRRRLFNIFFISIVSAILLLRLKNHFPITPLNAVLLGVSFFLVYLILALSTGCLDRHDVMVLKSIVGRKVRINKQ